MNEFWLAAGKRALRSFCQQVLLLGALNVTPLFSEEWWHVIVAALGLAITSILTSIVTGLPEAPAAETVETI